VVLGTRPGIVKFAPILHQLRAMDVEHFVVHSGQHYSANMDAVFFSEHGLAPPDFRVGDRSPDVTPGQQTAEMLAGIERVLLDQRPSVVLVGGDANTNLAGALAARKLDLLVGHVEAGLRSRDWRMPEEHNRVMIDHISDALFVPSERAAETARGEGVQGEIHVTGSTIGEALQRTLDEAPPAPPRRSPYALVTLHRQENVDNPEVLTGLVAAILKLPEQLDLDVIWPVHPRAQKRLESFGLSAWLEQEKRIQAVDALGHREFVQLLAGAALLLTDSGGAQQEACILRVPCVTARPSTEWVETVEVGANAVCGTEDGAVLEACAKMAASERTWSDPFSIGGVLPSRRTVDTTLDLVERHR
jgi:UDP-N-acetylglucosamine 2-epimerase (non-hydrolysing)